MRLYGREGKVYLRTAPHFPGAGKEIGADVSREAVDIRGAAILILEKL
jgi:hypothetical protein